MMQLTKRHGLSLVAFALIGWMSLGNDAHATSLILNQGGDPKTAIQSAKSDGDLDIYNEGPSRIIVTVCNPGTDCEPTTVPPGGKVGNLRVMRGGNVQIGLPHGAKKAKVDWSFR